MAVASRNSRLNSGSFRRAQQRCRRTRAVQCRPVRTARRSLISLDDAAVAAKSKSGLTEFVALDRVATFFRTRPVPSEREAPPTSLFLQLALSTTPALCLTCNQELSMRLRHRKE